VVVDGRPVAAYRRAYLSEGRVFAAVTPLLTVLADRVRLDDHTLVIERGHRSVRVWLPGAISDQLDALYVPAGPVLRALGASVRYDALSRRLLVTLVPRFELLSPAPFNSARPALPRPVFTPSPPPTPRPVWTGAPMPRRTALPMPPALDRVRPG
jgi:hypothetical protein